MTSKPSPGIAGESVRSWSGSVEVRQIDRGGGSGIGVVRSRFVGEQFGATDAEILVRRFGDHVVPVGKPKVQLANPPPSRLDLVVPLVQLPLVLLGDLFLLRLEPLEFLVFGQPLQFARRGVSFFRRAVFGRLTCGFGLVVARFVSRFGLVVP